MMTDISILYREACAIKRILTINPGSTSTKVAIFEDDKVLLKKKVEHSVQELKKFARVFDEYEYRLTLVMEAIDEAGIPTGSLDAVVGRGGLLKPLAGGTYLVNEAMVEDMKKAERGEHASNLGSVLAFNIARKFGIPAYIVDPVSVDEMDEVARISGLPEFERISKAHTLNMKAVARQVAQRMGKKYEEVSLIVAHLGTGISVASHYQGRMIDVSNGMDEGAFSLNRSGGLPIVQLVEACFSGEYSLAQLKRKISGDGGMFSYLGTSDMREVERMAAGGNRQAEILLQALIYQVAKEIGAMAAVLAGKVDSIVLTGGIAYSAKIVEAITGRIGFIAPVVVVPGEEEMEALTAGALRVLSGEEQVKIYQ